MGKNALEIAPKQIDLRQESALQKQHPKQKSKGAVGSRNRVGKVHQASLYSIA